MSKVTQKWGLLPNLRGNAAEKNGSLRKPRKLQKEEKWRKNALH